MISPLAYVDPKAEIGANVEIGPFCYIDKNVIIGDNNIIMPHACILSGTRIGKENHIFPGAVIGAVPQDLKYKGEETYVKIGDNNIIRENSTINKGTSSKGQTEIGNNNLLMEGMHIAHDCVVGNYCIVGNCTKFGGEVIVDNHATISAGVLIHQFCHIGGYVMIQGGSGCSKDVPPFITAGRNPLTYMGINVVRLRRLNYSNEQIDTIHNAYRIIYQSGMNISKAIDSLKKDPMSAMPEIQYIINFIEQAQRGIIRE